MELHDAETLAVSLMAQHGLIEAGWTFGFDGAKERFGHCVYSEKSITISRYLTALNDEAEVLDMLLHEIAHALAGSGAGHGPTWRRIAIEIGARGNRCYDSAVVVQPPAPYRVECPNCHVTYPRYRQRSRGSVACAACCKRYNGGRYSDRFIFVWHENTNSLRFHSDG